MNYVHAQRLNMQGSTENIRLTVKNYADNTSLFRRRFLFRDFFYFTAKMIYMLLVVNAVMFVVTVQ